MKNFRSFFREFVLQESAAVASEYAVLIGGVAAAIAFAVTVFGGAVQQLYQSFLDKFPK